MNKKILIQLLLSAATGLSNTVNAAVTGPTTISFNPFPYASISGFGNVEPLAGGNCPGSRNTGCYYEDGMAVGIVEDTSNPISHLHGNGSGSVVALGYHSDSSGIYVRAVDGSAFRLTSMLFEAFIDAAGNPGTGPDDVWEILGFNTAENPELDIGDGTNYSTRIAYQTVANGFNEVLTLDSAFNNINAFWIHYKGYPQTPIDGKQFSMQLDNIVLGAPVPLPAAAWLFGGGLMTVLAFGKKNHIC